MKIHIIQPSYYSDPVHRKLFRTRKLNVVPLTLPHLAALVPPENQVILTDEKIEPLNTDLPCDAVFLTVWTLHAFRAYEIAQAYREKGIPVVMGGPHCYFHPDEVLEYADAVAIGEGEHLVPQIIGDLDTGNLKTVYRSDMLHDLKGLPLPRRDLFNPKSITRFHTVSVQTSRGCPNSCEFCAERFYLGTKYRMRPVEEVMGEIRATCAKRLFFSDSTFAGNRNRTMNLMEQMIPLNLKWSALWTANRVLDEEFMRLAKRSGLLHLNLGIESIKQETLNSMRKRTTKADRLREMIHKLHDLKISFSFNLIFGWDTDRKEDFEQTINFLQENKVHAAFFNSFAPHKGTRIYDIFLSEGRILDPENMNRWPGVYAKIHPKHMTPDELEAGIKSMYKTFYSWPYIIRRLPLPLSESALASWSVNLSQRKFAFGEGTNFDNY